MPPSKESTERRKWFGDVILLLKHSPLESFQLYASGGTDEIISYEGIDHEAIREIVDSHAFTLRRIGIQRLIVPVESLAYICERCPQLEEIFATLCGVGRDTLAQALVTGRRLRNVHLTLMNDVAAHCPKLWGQFAAHRFPDKGMAGGEELFRWPDNQNSWGIYWAADSGAVPDDEGLKRGICLGDNITRSALDPGLYGMDSYTALSVFAFTIPASSETRTWRIQHIEGLNVPPHPHEYFDVIAGTGTGALQACMLGRLKMSTEEAIESYSKLVTDVFSDKKWFRGGRSSAFKSTRLRERVMDIVQSKTNNKDERMVDDHTDQDRCKTLHEFFPQCNHGSILVTTRLRNMGALAQGPDSDFCISEMDPQDALALLLKRARIQSEILSDEEKNAAIALLQDFGHLALAVTHAGAYMYSRQVNVATYRELFHLQRQAILDASGAVAAEVDGYQKTVYTTWKMCYDLLGPESYSAARPMLWLIAFLHHDSIREDIFKRALATLPDIDKFWLPLSELEAEARFFLLGFLSRFADSEGLWSRFAYLETMAELESTSLIEYDRANNVHAIHVLVQEWARTVLPCSPQVGLERSTLLVAFSIDYSHSLEEYTFRRLLFPHINKVVSEHVNRVIPILNYTERFARVYTERGRWEEAERLQLQACQAFEEFRGRENRGRLLSLAQLSHLIQSQGRSVDAERLRVQILEIQKRVMGETHPDTLMTMANLACTYGTQGKVDEQEILETQVLELRKQVLGDEHPDTLLVMANLAGTYMKQGKWKKAEKLWHRAIGIQRRVAGKEHPDTLASMCGLASTYLYWGKLTKAETLGGQALEVQKRILGEEHPYTLETMACLAINYRKQGHLVKAEALGVHVIEVQTRVMSKEHPQTLMTMSDLALTHERQSNWVKAEKVWEQVLEVRKRVQGEDHPDTLKIMNDLGINYVNQGRREEAMQLLVDTLRRRGRILGDNHPATLSTLELLMSSVFCTRVLVILPSQEVGAFN
ncbi:Nephrocystin-3 [Xenopus (Silurana) tropicalis] [Rhizoctonia solani]|uniref:Nephrocystin-3 [Xenopus (Silurana) tropicalis] n=1 Tax=Rhizoctonia solani TaxID=456999 RepID=A0A0K6FR51_9AGAM|nr:Nephrocystin-3 [Xenopus (Silurana) tropicalis] [Rhizoctonia solani]